MVHNYLLGKEPPAFDLLFWNSDGTRVPGKVHSFLLREFFLGNKLKEPDAIEVKGVGIDTRRITTPTYAVACESDHIVPWRGASKIRQMMGGPVRFVLAESGHIAGIINHPAKKKRGFWINNLKSAQKLDPDEWLAKAKKRKGSWWVIGSPGWRSNPASWSSRRPWAATSTHRSWMLPARTSWSDKSGVVAEGLLPLYLSRGGKMSEKSEKAGQPEGDPFSQMLQFYDDWTKTWSGAASEMASNKHFADSIAQQLESSLSTTQMMRRQMSELMEQSMQQMSMPTRREILSIAERMTSIEMRLDDMEAKVDQVLDLLKASQ